MTRKHHQQPRKAHIPLLTNFKLILLILMTFCKLLLLTGPMRGQFCNYFPSVLFSYREVQNLQKWMDKRHEIQKRVVLTQKPSEEKEPKPELFWWLSCHHLPHPVHQGPHSWSVGRKRHLTAIPVALENASPPRRKVPHTHPNSSAPRAGDRTHPFYGKYREGKGTGLRNPAFSTSRKHLLKYCWKLGANCSWDLRVPTHRPGQGMRGLYSKGSLLDFHHANHQIRLWLTQQSQLG